MNIEKVNVQVFRTSDTKLASFLITTGHLPQKPPFTRQEMSGKTRAVWGFDDFTDKNFFGRTINESLLIWKGGIKYLKENPDCTEGKVMQALKTYDTLTSLIGRDDLGNTLVFYEVDGYKFSAIKGTEKEKMLAEKGEKV